MILVTGATGHVGSELVQQLIERGEDVRALVRNPSKATKLPPTADVVVGDLEDLPSLLKAFQGTDRIFLLVPGIGHKAAETALLAAKEVRIRSLAYLSSYATAITPMPAMGRW